MIYIKKEKDIQSMRTGGAMLGEILYKLKQLIKPGISTQDINDIAEAFCKKNNVIPAFKGYNGFPATVCVGIDDVAVHGIPSKDEILKEGQIISVDMGLIYKDMFLDSAFTTGVGQIDADAQRLLDTTELALKNAISKAVEGNTVGDIGNAIEQVALLAGFSVIEDMTGHGVGYKLHEDPAIPCFGDPGTGPKLQAGMTVALEPMLNEGGPDLTYSDDGWTTKTKDGGRSAIFEHSIVIGKGKAEILTKKL